MSIRSASNYKRANVRDVIAEIPGYTLFFDGADIANTNEFEFSDIPEAPALLHLEALGLVWVNAGAFTLEGEASFVLNAQLTLLGASFVSLFEKEDDPQ